MNNLFFPKLRKKPRIFATHSLSREPNSPATPRGGSPPAPSAGKSATRTAQKTAPLRPLRAPRRFRNPKIGQQLGAQPTPGFKAILLAEIDVEIDAVLDPLPSFAFATHIALLVLREIHKQPRPPRPCEVGWVGGRCGESGRNEDGKGGANSWSSVTGECLAGNAEVNPFCAQKTEACKVKKGKVKERR